MGEGNMESMIKKGARNEQGKMRIPLKKKDPANYKKTKTRTKAIENASYV
jgi:hypothetical protein